MYKLDALFWSVINYLNSLKKLLKDFNINSSNIYISDYYQRKSDSQNMKGFSISICDKKSIINFKRYIGFDLAYKQDRLNKAVQT